MTKFLSKNMARRTQIGLWRGANAPQPGCRTVSNNGSGLAPAQNILAVQVWFGFTQVQYY